MDTARPALSSAGEVIFEPDDKRCKDAFKLLWDCISSVAAFCADRFVLMTITTLSVSRPGRGWICATSMSRTFQLGGETSLIPRQRFKVADHRLSCDNPFIGGNSRNLTKIFPGPFFFEGAEAAAHLRIPPSVPHVASSVSVCRNDSVERLAVAPASWRIDGGGWRERKKRDSFVKLLKLKNYQGPVQNSPGRPAKTQRPIGKIMTPAAP